MSRNVVEALTHFGQSETGQGPVQPGEQCRGVGVRTSRQAHALLPGVPP